MTQDSERHRIDVSGIVQGIGFRPFIYRLAIDKDLSGTVRNCAGVVRIEIQGARASSVFVSVS